MINEKLLGIYKQAACYLLVMTEIFMLAAPVVIFGPCVAVLSLLVCLPISLFVLDPVIEILEEKPGKKLLPYSKEDMQEVEDFLADIYN